MKLDGWVSDLFVKAKSLAKTLDQAIDEKWNEDKLVSEVKPGIVSALSVISAQTGEIVDDTDFNYLKKKSLKKTLDELIDKAKDKLQ